MIQDTIVVLAQRSDAGRDLLPLWTGILGGVIGLGTTYLAAWASRRTALDQIEAQKSIANAQIHATVVSSNRVRWIEQVRSEVAGFVATTNQIMITRGYGLVEGTVREKLERALVHGSAVQLLLYPDEPKQGALHEAVERVIGYLRMPAVDEDANRLLRSALEEVHAAALEVFRLHWQRAKRAD